MHWRLGDAICRLRGHRVAYWTTAPGGPLIVCIRCHRVL